MGANFTVTFGNGGPTKPESARPNSTKPDSTRPDPPKGVSEKRVGNTPSPKSDKSDKAITTDRSYRTENNRGSSGRDNFGLEGKAKMLNGSIERYNNGNKDQYSDWKEAGDALRNVADITEGIIDSGKEIGKRIGAVDYQVKYVGNIFLGLGILADAKDIYDADDRTQELVIKGIGLTAIAVSIFFFPIAGPILAPIAVYVWEKNYSVSTYNWLKNTQFTTEALTVF